MCECCIRKMRCRMPTTRMAIVIREKFIRPKIRGVEVQGHKHGSFFIGIQSTSKELVNEVFCFPKYN